MDLEQGAECPKKFERAPERQTTIKAYEGGPALVLELILSDVLPYRKHSILFAGQMCHR